MSNKEKYTMTVAEMGERLGISRPMAYDLVNRADFPAIRIGERRILVPVEAFEKWLEAQIRKSAG